MDMRVTWWENDIHTGYVCNKCGTFVPKFRSQMGKRSRTRGNAQERRIASDTGGKRVGHHGGKEDVVAGLYSIQSKSGAFPERPWKYLQEIPRDGGRIPVVVLMDAPGPGVKRRGVVVMQYEDWLDASGVKA
jgi:hypothetical protein